MKECFLIAILCFSISLNMDGQNDIPVEGTQRSSIVEQWDFLTDSVNGCLVGKQYCYDGKCGHWECCFDKDKRWETFFNQDKSELASFLITQLPDTSKSKTHVCPFFVATKGELAVYALQRIYVINWFDLDPKYYKYRDGTLESGVDYYSYQEELQKELSDSLGLKLLTEKWLER